MLAVAIEHENIARKRLQRMAKLLSGSHIYNANVEARASDIQVGAGCLY